MSPKVLVVDEDPAARETLRSLVVALGYTCRVAVDGAAAWESHQVEPADVVLCAWPMRRTDGADFCRRVRATDGAGHYTCFVAVLRVSAGSASVSGLPASGAEVDGYLVEPVDRDDLGVRLASFARMVAVQHRLVEDNERLRRDGLASFQLARVDPLTGVANRLRMDEDLAVLWAQARRYGRSYCGALCDIDNFKRYNDEYGHVAGDDVLRRVAQTIRAQMRGGDVVYRYGGEEFLAILPEQSPSMAAQAMNRVRREVEALGIVTPAGPRVVTISVGVAALAHEDTDVEHWLRRVDAALYGAKASGRNRVAVDWNPAGPARETEAAARN